MPTDFLFWLLLILFQKLCQKWPKDDAEDCKRALNGSATYTRCPTLQDYWPAAAGLEKNVQSTSDWLTQLSWAMPEQPIRSLQIQLSLAISFLKFLAISTISIYYFWFYLFIQVMSNMKRLIFIILVLIHEIIGQHQYEFYCPQGTKFITTSTSFDSTFLTAFSQNCQCDCCKYGVQGIF